MVRQRRRTQVTEAEAVAGSFRDPSGFLFTSDGTLPAGRRALPPVLDALHESGLYWKLGRRRLLIPHAEVSTELAPRPGAYWVIRPEPIHFISYSVRWCFPSRRTLRRHASGSSNSRSRWNLILKDAQSLQHPVSRWAPAADRHASWSRTSRGRVVAYRQFCQHSRRSR
jgi:hypothetical protein